MIRKQLLIVASLCMISLYGQTSSLKKEDVKTYKLAVSNGKLNINLGRATIEGYDGKEIIFSNNKTIQEIDERAKGLRAINAMGLEDNTGLGINVVEKNGMIEVHQLKRIDSPEIKILVPRNVVINFSHQSQYGGDIIFKNIENEIEASSSYNNMFFENVTGPTTINSIYGSVTATFNQNIKGALSIVSIYGEVDITLPKTTKANVKITTNYGEILVAPELPLKLIDNAGMVKYNDQLNATINGGGNSFNFRSDYGKIYIRAL